MCKHRRSSVQFNCIFKFSIKGCNCYFRVWHHKKITQLKANCQTRYQLSELSNKQELEDLFKEIAVNKPGGHD